VRWTPSHSHEPGNIWARVRVSFKTGAVWSANLTTAGLLVELCDWTDKQTYSSVTTILAPFPQRSTKLNQLSFSNSVARVTSPQSNLRRAALQRPHTLQWDAQNSPPKLPIAFDDHHLHLIHPFLDQRSQHPNWHPDPISRFVTTHNTLSRQTDTHTQTHTDGLGDRSVT